LAIYWIEGVFAFFCVHNGLEKHAYVANGGTPMAPPTPTAGRRWHLPTSKNLAEYALKSIESRQKVYKLVSGVLSLIGKATKNGKQLCRQR
ncbi:MAG: hypothetical protein IKX48_10835, partial [Victivallales bacterium]|nr:hypothetical protein [Victivallales bacterium]